MKSHAVLLFLLVCLNGIIDAQSKKFAVLVTTTKSWLHYGHQSTMLHAYQTLIANGFPRSNIITMFYDDIADHERNPEKGVIRNHPQGKNVYENVTKDYTGENVTAANFIGVITGNKTLANGPVIESSGSKDTLFLYLVGLSASQYLTFPTGPGIPSRKLKYTLETLTQDGKFKKIFVSSDLSYGQSLFEEFSFKSRVFVSTSTLDEHPHLVYCFPEKRMCYGSLYGVVWTQYSDRLRQLKSGDKRTLFNQFTHVRAEIPYTRVSIYGDLRVGRSKLQEFLGYNHEGKANRDAIKVGLATPDQDQLDTQTHADADARATRKDQPHFDVGTIYDQQMSVEEKLRTVKNRNFITETMKNIFDHLQNNGYKNIRYEKAEKPRQRLSENHSDFYEDAIREFHERCININENPFALHEISKLIHLGTNNVSLDDLKSAMIATCTEKHRLTADVY